MMISADATIKEVLRLSLEKKRGCLPVVQGHTLVGIITETNLLRYVVDLPYRYLRWKHTLIRR